jgi:predicted transport protein
LTAYNAEMGDRPFLEKRGMDGGFAQSHLWLNADLDPVEEWNEAAIVDRAGRLMDRAVQVWTEPPAQYIQSMDMVGGVSTGGDAIDGYEFLGRGGATRTLFESFRVLVRGLDPCMTEDFLKRYIAYKAETNFVDVVPQANGLQLTLNMSFADLDDPRGLALDVTGVGRWGNGDVAVRLTELDQLPYVVSLVRQSLERQMADWDSSPSEAPVFVDDLEIAD